MMGYGGLERVLYWWLSAVVRWGMRVSSWYPAGEGGEERGWQSESGVVVDGPAGDAKEKRWRRGKDEAEEVQVQRWDMSGARRRRRGALRP